MAASLCWLVRDVLLLMLFGNPVFEREANDVSLLYCESLTLKAAGHVFIKEDPVNLQQADQRLFQVTYTRGMRKRVRRHG